MINQILILYDLQYRVIIIIGQLMICCFINRSKAKMVFHLGLLRLTLNYISQPIFKVTCKLRNVEVINNQFVRVGYFLDRQTRRFDSMVGIKLQPEISQQQAFEKTNRLLIEGLFVYGVLVYLLVEQVRKQVKKSRRMDRMIDKLENQFHYYEHYFEKNRENMLEKVDQIDKDLDSAMVQITDN